MDLHLNGKAALVTGGSRGIGHAIAARLSTEGCRVGICGRDPDTLAEATAGLGRAESDVVGVIADVTRPGEVERFVEAAAAALGGVDLLVANVGGGAVVIVSSISASKPSPRAQYGAAKAAENYLASTFARELGPLNIRVNAVSPGSVLFPDGGWERYSRRHPNEFDEFVQRDFPARRLGTVDEVADVVTFLPSERASWVNGATIAVDGAQGRPSANGY
ncbi:short-chain dehydrogenase/reductase SDR [Parafrankia sp. EAN1pec]|uniref:SDR family NAD(P)-dependent oxidoreductase n=1 Tax=Parafrankia sp. (strain EAN1pec) TaxID=298653 RepID=UPI0000541BC6|nr:short-chain dehydrogenase/reductase SDR [Frankia sp. EAN1pec]